MMPVRSILNQRQSLCEEKIWNHGGFQYERHLEILSKRVFHMARMVVLVAQQ